jgi:hypothetical protein
MALNDAELRGDAEQLGDELCLSDHVIRSYPSHSTFSHHLHRFNPAESSPRSAHGTVAFGEPRSPFYVAVILLDRLIADDKNGFARWPVLSAPHTVSPLLRR